MKNVRSSIALAVAALFVAYGAQAQTAASPTREQVKQEAIQSNKAGTTVTGECSGDQKADVGACKKAPVTSTKSREEVKKEAAAANKAGETSKANKPDMPTKTTSTKARADVKAEAASANKAGTIESGQATNIQKKEEGAMKK